MNGYLLAVIGIIVAFVAVVIIATLVAVIKGFRAGETVIEVQIAGILRFSIHLSGISQKRAPTKKKHPVSPKGS
jgi:hypothetical protein